MDDPTEEKTDYHIGPLDDEDDARYLDPTDARRRAIERKRGRPFNDENGND